ncbi:MAG: hypothetical protein HYS81_01040 [Candidatus Aenigmatarchaeota archaeon]|nr:MAG: hypothetical protein HYS81_01040 [Candidatus Aenigmarchaeota archaeon]
MEDSIVKRLVDVTESVTEKVTAVQKRLDDIERKADSLSETEGQQAAHLDVLRKEVSDKLRRLENTVGGFEADVSKSVAEGIAKGTSAIRQDFDAFRKDAFARLKQTSADSATELRDLQIRLDRIEAQSGKSDKETREVVEREMAAGIAALNKKIDSSIDALDKTLAERRTELAAALRASLDENRAVVSDITTRMTSLENVASLQEAGTKKYVSAEIAKATDAMKDAVRSAAEASVSRAKASMDKELEQEKLYTARVSEEQRAKLIELARRLEVMDSALRVANDGLAGRLERMETAMAESESALENRMMESMNTKLLKISGNFKDVNETLAAVIKDLNSEKESLRSGIAALVEQQLDEKGVFQKIDGKIEYLENLVDLQNKGFDEKLSREVNRAVADSTVQHQQRFDAMDSQMRAFEGSVENARTRAEIADRELEKQVVETAEAMKKEVISIAESLRSHVNAMDGKYNKQLDYLKQSHAEKAEALQSSVASSLADITREHFNSISDLQRKLDAIDNVLALQRTGEENLRKEFKESLDAMRSEVREQTGQVRGATEAASRKFEARLQEIRGETKARLEQFRTGLEPMVAQRVDSRAHALEGRMDEKYGGVQRNLKESVREILTQDAEALATAKVENVLFALSEELDRKKRQAESEIEKIQARAVASVDDIRRQIESDVQRVHSDLDQNARRLRAELEEVQRLKARVAAEAERTGPEHTAELLARIERLENEISSLKGRTYGPYGQQPIILE